MNVGDETTFSIGNYNFHISLGEIEDGSGSFYCTQTLETRLENYLMEVEGMEAEDFCKHETIWADNLDEAIEKFTSGYSGNDDYNSEKYQLENLNY